MEAQQLQELYPEWEKFQQYRKNWIRKIFSISLYGKTVNSKEMKAIGKIDWAFQQEEFRYIQQEKNRSL